jgi:hypothetical protein
LVVARTYSWEMSCWHLLAHLILLLLLILVGDSSNYGVQHTEQR